MTAFQLFRLEIDIRLESANERLITCRVILTARDCEETSPATLITMCNEISRHQFDRSSIREIYFTPTWREDPLLKTNALDRNAQLRQTDIKCATVQCVELKFTIVGDYKRQVSMLRLFVRNGSGERTNSPCDYQAWRNNGRCDRSF